MTRLAQLSRPAAIIGIVGLSACVQRGTAYMPVGGGEAMAELRSSSGASHGTLRFVLVEGGVNISGTLTGLQSGAHGMHLHAVGRCDAPDFETAGPHHNPTSKEHGLDNPAGPHAGDMPQIIANVRGSATVDVTTSRLAFGTPATDSAMRSTGAFTLDADGAALVVHAEADDQRTDPSGKSGARFACGTVTVSR